MNLALYFQAKKLKSKMQNKTLYNQIIFLSLYVLLLSGCGRKQKNIFSFAKEPEKKITKLDLPAVRGLTVTKTDLGNQLTWFDLFTVAKNTYFKDNFIGYDVFRLTKSNFIPKRPLNQNPLKETQFIDKNQKTKRNNYYLVQPIFNFDNQIIRGPSSQIVGVQN